MSVDLNESPGAALEPTEIAHRATALTVQAKCDPNAARLAEAERRRRLSEQQAQLAEAARREQAVREELERKRVIDRAEQEDLKTRQREEERLRIARGRVENKPVTTDQSHGSSDRTELPMPPLFDTEIRIVVSWTELHRELRPKRGSHQVRKVMRLLIQNGKAIAETITAKNGAGATITIKADGILGEPMRMASGVPILATVRDGPTLVQDARFPSIPRSSRFRSSMGLVVLPSKTN